jgi:hypothetical protein
MVNSAHMAWIFPAGPRLVLEVRSHFAFAREADAAGDLDVCERAVDDVQSAIGP